MTPKRLGFREWQWKFGKNVSEEQDVKDWRRYYFRKTKAEIDKWK